MRRRTVPAGVLTASGPAAGTARAAGPGSSGTGKGATRLDARAVRFVSYDGLVTNNSCRRNTLLTHQGHRYGVRHTATRNAVVARRALGAPTRSTLTLPHRLKADDSHNVISTGVPKADGRLHLHTDSHNDGFFHVESGAGTLAHPDTAWTPAVLRTTLDGPALASRFTTPSAPRVGDFALPA
ncbi:BNR-4 repeat-containing protein [Streptomyces sp. NPDC048521]|uniref:BNR-4 repeat-containing protein n=1 Tax=Streptomyces sp. NPDC048521 TaxID=3365566 RepID=UPI0037153EF1